MQYRKNEQHTEKLKKLEGHLQFLLEKVKTLQQNDPFSDDDIKGVAMGLFEAGIAWIEFKDVPTHFAKVDK